jgi:tRNA pseudouridine65 synthase
MQILYHDDYLVAVNKPPGLLVHRTRIDKDETNYALQTVRDLIGRHVYPVHRLDKPTSGILLFALQPEAAALITSLFATRQIKKAYLAVIRGYVNEQGMIDYPLMEQHDKMTDASAHTNKAAQPAVTQYQRLATIELPIPVGRYRTARYSLLEAVPLTGRKHQIRRHMKHIFHPIIGDTTFGDGAHNKLFREKFASHRLLLHARYLSLPHPYLNRPIEITAPLDKHFGNVIDRFNWSV